MGFHVALVGRNQAKLEKAKAEVEECKAAGSNALTKTIVFDFNVDYSPAAYEPLFTQLDQLGDISVFVNNVGVSHYEPLHEQPDECVMDMMRTNMLPQVFCSRYALNKMMKRSTRSAIVNVSSISAF